MFCGGSGKPEENHRPHQNGVPPQKIGTRRRTGPGLPWQEQPGGQRHLRATWDHGGGYPLWDTRESPPYGAKCLGLGPFCCTEVDSISHSPGPGFSFRFPLAFHDVQRVPDRNPIDPILDQPQFIDGVSDSGFSWESDHFWRCTPLHLPWSRWCSFGFLWTFPKRNEVFYEALASQLQKIRP